jgi:hypothetical protein
MECDAAEWTVNVKVKGDLGSAHVELRVLFSFLNRLTPKNSSSAL